MTVISSRVGSPVVSAPSTSTGSAVGATDFGPQLRASDLSSQPIYRAIGMAEGTVTASGQKTSAWYGHGDPGNGRLNRGFGSYQVYQHRRGAGLSAAEADRVQADRLATQWPRIDKALTQAGFVPGPVRDLVAANALDAWNQAPETQEGKHGLLNPAQLGELKGRVDRGEPPVNAVVSWRTNAFRNDSGRLEAGGFGNSLPRLTADQRRRTEAVAQGISAPGAAGGATAPVDAAPADGPAPAGAPLAQHSGSPAIAAHQGVSSFDSVNSPAPGRSGRKSLMDLLNEVTSAAGSLPGVAPAASAQLPGGATAAAPTLDAGVPATPGAPAAPLAPAERHPWMDTLATARLNNGPTGMCVETTLKNLDRLGIPSFQGGTSADPNNPRGALVQMIKKDRWQSLPLEGSQQRTIRSPYGTVQAHVLNADAYERMAKAGQIPSGAILFQTRHGWDYSGGSRGNDMGIVRDGGRATHNYKTMSPIIYGDAREVVVLVPR